MLKIGIISIIIAIIFFLSSSSSYAAPKFTCKASNPGSTPIITEVKTVNNTVTLSWTKAADPVTHYLLAYGMSKDGLNYGVPNMGGKDTTSFTIGELIENQRYYFRIRAVNDCEGGDFSDTVSVIVGKNTTDTMYKMPNLSLYKSVLGTSTSAQKKHTVGMAPVRVSPFCASCLGLPLLAIQGFLLLFYLYLSHKISFCRPLFSLVFPLLFFAIFKFAHQDCNTNVFFCRYYVQLTIILYVLVMALHKFIFIHRKIEANKEQFMQSLSL